MVVILYILRTYFSIYHDLIGSGIRLGNCGDMNPLISV